MQPQSQRMVHRLVYGKGNASGNNVGHRGYTNGTRDEPGKNPDRHVHRSPWRGKAMKCGGCFNYNKGVTKGECSACGHQRFGTDMQSRFAKLIQEQTWDATTQKANSINIQTIWDLLKKVLGPSAVVSRQGSSRKHTDIYCSDLDLMVDLTTSTTMSVVQKQMTVHQRKILAEAINEHPVFLEAQIGLNAIQVVPHVGSHIDIVAHHSNFGSPAIKTYLRPAGVEFFEWPSGQTAVRALKLWANSHKQYKVHKVPGVVWEELVLSLTADQRQLNTATQWVEWAVADPGTGGLKLFQDALGLLTMPHEQARPYLERHCPASRDVYDKHYAKLDLIQPVVRKWLAEWQASEASLEEKFRRMFHVNDRVDASEQDLSARFARSVCLGEQAGVVH